MIETPKKDNIGVDISDTSSIKEPDTPVLKTCKPKTSIPLFVLDPICNEVETCGKSIFYSKDDIFRRLFASPVKKMITKGKFVDKNRIIKCKKLMKNLTHNKRNNVIGLKGHKFTCIVFNFK